MILPVSSPISPLPFGSATHQFQGLAAGLALADVNRGLVARVFLVIDLAFFGANLLKIADGGWIPLLLGALFFVVMTTWHGGT